MDLALAHFANDTGPGLWLWSWHPGLAVALAWICLGPMNPNLVNVCPGRGGTVPKGGPAQGLEVLVEVSQSSCFNFQIAKVQGMFI